MDEEPLKDWAQRREVDRERKKGRLRAVPLGPGRHRGFHVHPQAPRVIEQWDGYEWTPVTVADDLAAAQDLLHPSDPAGEPAGEWDRPAPGKPPGKHRKPERTDRRET
ncbi:DUF6087 family protein [Streptomyces syringium]|uniref:DUF6087 family protein n=1 Tax=Streptomyces syringium TaxID=76729 RepID=UPI00369A81A7